jgi:hypothetical protein
MAPKHHPTPLSGGDRKALNKELGKARAMTNILAAQSVENRTKGEALIRTADKLLCESWNERMWADGEPIDPSHRSTRRSTAAILGSRSSVRAAGPGGTSTSPRCATRRRRWSTTWPAGSAAASAPRPTAAPRRPFCSLRRGHVTRPRRSKDVQPLFDHDQPGGHQRTLPRGKPLRRQPRADAERLSGLQCADRPRRR